MRFDVNQTDFPSVFQKKIWKRGIAVMPLDITLNGINDSEMREGLTQIYSFMMEFFWDMYNNPEKHSNVPYKSTEHYVRAIMNESKTTMNNKYPLLKEYMDNFFSLVWSLKPKAAAHNWGIVQMCDFRCFNKADKKAKTQDVDDLLYTLSDKNRKCFKELHEYVTEKGAKKESGRYRYKYKGEHIISFDWKPSIFISYKIKSGNSFESFVWELNKQPDKVDLLDYIQKETTICNHCGLSTCKDYVEFLICTPRNRKRHHHFAVVDTNKIKIGGMEINRGCLHHLDDITQPFTDEEIKMMKRLIDIRFSQIGNA